jgi:hypothetical protein
MKKHLRMGLLCSWGLKELHLDHASLFTSRIAIHQASILKSGKFRPENQRKT